ncbi:MAG TPA: hypothetical protein VGH99_05140 [Pseudonocardia sp.]
MALSVARVPRLVAAVTLVGGVGLTVAPRRAAAVMGIGDQPDAARAIGVMDLALVPGLLRGRPVWPWMVARALFNLPVAAAYRSEAQRSGAALARGGMLAMLGLTAADAGVALALRRADRRARTPAG